MAVSTTTQPNLETTSLSATVAPTPPGFSSSGPTTQYSIGAILTQADTTLTAFEVTTTTGMAVIDGSTLTWRNGGLTLSNGVIVSVGFWGLEVPSTTASYSPIAVGTGARSVSIASLVPNPMILSKLTAMQGNNATTIVTTSRSQSAAHTGRTNMTSSSSGGSVVSGGTVTTTSSSSSLSPSSSSSAAAPSLGAGKTLALIGALVGVIACGI